MSKYLVGYDIGGTKIEAVLLEYSPVETQGSQPVFFNQGKGYYKILTRERVLTERDKGYDSILLKIKELYASTVKSLPSSAQVSGVGLGLPGTIDPTTGRMHNGNTSAFVGQDLRTDFEDLFFDVERVELANDANCFAWAEVVAGAGLEFSQRRQVAVRDQLAVGVILGTGCGAGIVFGGKFLEGANGGAGEMGHSLLVSSGRSCFCGRQGCAELYVSGTGLELSYHEVSGRELGTYRAQDVFDWATQGEAEARRAVDAYCGHLAAFLANMTNVIDPHYFVLGGGVSLQPVIYSGLHKSVQGDLFLPVDPPEILQNKLGDSAGVLGAAFLPLRHL